MFQVKGKWALITGAARGIGYLTARFMAEQGLQSYSKINKMRKGNQSINLTRCSNGRLNHRWAF